MQNNLRNSLLVNLPYKKSQNSSTRKKICQKHRFVQRNSIKTKNKGTILFKILFILNGSLFLTGNSSK